MIECPLSTRARKIHQDLLQRGDILLLSIDRQRGISRLNRNAEQIFQESYVFVEGPEQQLQTSIG